MPDLDERIDRLLAEIEHIRELDRKHGDFKAWRQRAQTAINEKLGAKSQASEQLAGLAFYSPTFVYYDGMPETTPAEHREAFLEDLDTAKGILLAAREAAPPHHSRSPSGGPSIKRDCTRWHSARWVGDR